MEIKDLLWALLVACLSCLLTLIVKDLYDKAKKKVKNPYEKIDDLDRRSAELEQDMILIKESQRNQLWLSLIRTYNHCMEKGYATDLEKIAIKESLGSYTGLGGNHGMEHQIEEIMMLPPAPPKPHI